MKRIALVAVFGCSASPANVPPLGDYTTWKRLDTYGETAGHGNTYRIIYANDIAATTVGGSYAPGMVLVKEIHDNVNDTPGALQTIEISRRIGAATGSQHGWIFTTTSQPGGTETEGTTCWRRCHQASPFDGAWFDYSK